MSSKPEMMNAMSWMHQILIDKDKLANVQNIFPDYLMIY